jgi:hypothetical protein
LTDFKDNKMKYFTIPFIILLIFGKSDLNECGLFDSPQSTEQSNMKNPVHLNGLERIYFQCVGKENAPKNELKNVHSLLPATLSKIDIAGKQYNSGSDEYRILVRDYPIPIKRSNIWLREVIDHTHPRISKLWWAVYNNGRRSDIWYFTALPDRTDNKLLPNYKIDSVVVSAENLVTVQVNGNMFRPGGAWTVKGIEITFTLDKNYLKLNRVINVFSILHGYHDGDALEVMMEQVVEDRFDHRVFTPVTEEILRECGLVDLLSDEGWEYTWEELKKGAICITSRPGTKTTYRGLDDPSFIERGWKSEKE